MQTRVIENQIRAAIARFPKLSYRRNEGKKFWIIEGDLDICDSTGVYWDTFQIAIILNDKYPNSVPVVFEVSEKIPRISDRHISGDGACCLDIEHKLLRMASRGIQLSEFIATKVYPFFANQIYFEKHERFAGQEYSHRFAGVEEFYRDELQIPNAKTATLILTSILSKSLPERNERCICGQEKKYKKCHMHKVEFLEAIGTAQLLKDLDNFREEMARDQARPESISKPPDHVSSTGASSNSRLCPPKSS